MRRSQAANEARERDLLGRLPVVADHVPNSVTHDYDALLVEPFETTPPVSVVEAVFVPAETPLELKTCQTWISDAGSGAGRRRGMFIVSRQTHERLVDAGGFYLFAVLDDEDVTAALLAPADAVGERFRWVNGGTVSKKANVPWPELFDREVVEGVEV